MRTSVAVVRRASVALLLLAALGSLAVAAAVRTDRIRLSRVLTGSMEPTVPAGAVVVSTPADAAAIRPGHVLMFLPPPPFGGGTPVVHRVVDVTTDSGDVLVRTKGDANDAEDPWTLNATRSTIYDVQGSSAKAGVVMEAVARGGGSLLVTVVVAVVALRVLRALWRPSPRGRRRAARNGLRWLHDVAAS